jgi:hypothetical protein
MESTVMLLSEWLCWMILRAACKARCCANRSFLNGLIGVRLEAHEGNLAVRRNYQFSELDVKSEKHSDSDLSYCAETMMLNEGETRILSKTQLKRGTTQDARLGR